LADGDGVIIDHAEDGLVLILHSDPLADSADVITDMEIASWLNAGEDAWFFGISHSRFILILIV
jgi:hypothetical protein